MSFASEFMHGDLLSALNLQPHKLGWSGLIRDAPRFFGREISIDVHTLEFDIEHHNRKDGVAPPAISAKQASLVRLILPALSSIVECVEREMTDVEASDPGFREVVRNPHVWLSAEADDDLSWTFVVESTMNPDFGWHFEFKGAEFLEVWSGD